MTEDKITEILDHKLGIFIEHMNDQFTRVLEAVGDMQEKVDKIPQMQEDVGELKQDMKVVKAAVTDTSRQVNNHEHRITRLEAAA